MEAAFATIVARSMGVMVKDLLQLDKKLKARMGVKRKMKKLKELSTIIDAVIRDVESHPFTDDAVKDLCMKLQYLAYDLDDAVAYYYDTEVSRKQRSRASFKPVRVFVSSINQLLFKNKMGGMIKAVTDSLDSILLQKSIILELPQENSRKSPTVYRETHSRNSLVVIGRETEKQIIVNMLTDDDHDDESSHGTLKVITIVGMGGLGKTTLAQLVFNDERVKAHFASSRMWTIVGAEFDPAKIMKSVLELTTCKPVYISETDLLRQKLEKTLSGKRFLLVLDDVWNEDALKWGVLKAALTCGARGSKILVTTRSLHISSIMGSSKTHQLQQLSEDDCLFLFRQYSFGDRAVDQGLMEIDGKIVEKCGGVPLAVISLGSMLHSTRDEIYWSSLLNSKIWKLEDKENNLLAVLKLSYDTLSPRSKKCFAFGSLYPKNSTMVKDKLIKLWIANGFVCSDENFEAETIGNHIFTELVLKSFLLSASSKERDSRDFLWAPSEEYDFVDVSHVTHCTMHDLMHDLARSVSADAYWNSKEDSAKDIRNRICHLHMRTYFENLSTITRKKSLRLRTLILNYLSLNAEQLEFVFSGLKFLRALDLTDNGIREVPTSIKNLVLLRYLNLSKNTIETLPDSITLLPNLQYLDLSFNYGLRELPKELWNMRSLRDLDCRCRDNSNFGVTQMPCGLSRLTNLRCLTVFVAGDRSGACSITELENLKLHGEMTIKFSENFTNYSGGGRKILKNKDLNELCLEFNRSENNEKDLLNDLCPNTSLKKLTIYDYWSRQFPSWLMESLLPNLIQVSLVNYGVRDNYDVRVRIPPFGNLQFLKKLNLDSMGGITFLGAEFHGSGGFPSLQQLILNRMDNLEEWSESHGAEQLFPSLQWLRISSCPNLKSMPRLPKIHSLEILNCGERLLPLVGRLTSLSVLQVSNFYLTNFPSGFFRNLTSLTELQSNSNICLRMKCSPYN